jgi:hypothetical protein
MPRIVASAAVAVGYCNGANNDLLAIDIFMLPASRAVIR